MENTKNENKIDLNSLSISELKQMVSDLDSYVSKCYESRLKYHSPELYELRKALRTKELFNIKKEDLSFLEVGNVYGFFGGYGPDLTFSIAELVKMEFISEAGHRESTFSSILSKGYSLREVECFFRREEDLINNTKNQEGDDIGLVKKYIICDFESKKSSKGARGNNSIYSLDRNLLNSYYDSLKETKTSFKECERKVQFANLKKQEIEQAIRTNEKTLFDGDEDEYESLTQKYGRTI